MENKENNNKSAEIEKDKNIEDIQAENKEISSDEKVSKEEYDKLKSEMESYKDRLLRTAAEYDNFRKRTEREKMMIYSNATSDAVNHILPVADSLELALKSIEGTAEEYQKGLKLVSNQLNSALTKIGVESFGEVGDEFNPDIHNAVSHVDDEKEKENVISGVFQKGYKMGDKIIRHAMVQVAN